MSDILCERLQSVSSQTCIYFYQNEMDLMLVEILVSVQPVPVDSQFGRLLMTTLDIMSLTNTRLLNIALCITSVGADLSANLLKIQVSNYVN
jgi:hypothetical protein